MFVIVWSIGRNPALWDASEEFVLERFLGNKIGVHGHNFELLPFGSGRQMCPGYSLGIKVIHVSLANLLRGFAWRLPTVSRKKS
jgi:cytochrome P450